MWLAPLSWPLAAAFGMWSEPASSYVVSAPGRSAVRTHSTRPREGEQVVAQSRTRHHLHVQSSYPGLLRFWGGEMPKRARVFSRCTSASVGLAWASGRCVAARWLPFSSHHVAQTHIPVNSRRRLRKALRYQSRARRSSRISCDAGTRGGRRCLSAYGRPVRTYLPRGSSMADSPSARGCSRCPRCQSLAE